jgi:hypothetical protein
LVVPVTRIVGCIAIEVATSCVVPLSSSLVPPFAVDSVPVGLWVGAVGPVGDVVASGDELNTKRVPNRGCIGNIC